MTETSGGAYMEAGEASLQPRLPELLLRIPSFLVPFLFTSPCPVLLPFHVPLGPSSHDTDPSPPPHCNSVFDASSPGA